MFFRVRCFVGRKGKIWVGTSGWQYKHWIGTFYPAGIKTSQQLAYYLKYFKTVEINNSFYRLPKPETFANWRKLVPGNFIFSVQANRFITHNKKLKIGKPGLQVFFKNVSKLKEKLGPVLFQLPPKWNVNTERLEEFLRLLPRKFRYAFEFRNPSWYIDEVHQLLGKYNSAFCIYELAHHLSPRDVTADFVYIRLHGPGRKYQGSYDDKVLKKWTKDCRRWQTEGKDVFVYFDNDQAGYAAFNATRLIELTGPKKISRKKKKK